MLDQEFGKLSDGTCQISDHRHSEILIPLSCRYAVESKDQLLSELSPNAEPVCFQNLTISRWDIIQSDHTPR